MQFVRAGSIVLLAGLVAATAHGAQVGTKSTCRSELSAQLELDFYPPATRAWQRVDFHQSTYSKLLGQTVWIKVRDGQTVQGVLMSVRPLGYLGGAEVVLLNNRVQKVLLADSPVAKVYVLPNPVPSAPDTAVPDFSFSEFIYTPSLYPAQAQAQLARRLNDRYGVAFLKGLDGTQSIQFIRDISVQLRDSGAIRSLTAKQLPKGASSFESQFEIYSENTPVYLDGVRLSFSQVSELKKGTKVAVVQAPGIQKVRYFDSVQNDGNNWAPNYEFRMQTAETFEQTPTVTISADSIEKLLLF